MMRVHTYFFVNTGSAFTEQKLIFFFGALLLTELWMWDIFIRLENATLFFLIQ